MRLEVDGAAHVLPDALGAQSLLRLLREELGITAVKNACEQGECGSCTVLVNGRVECACLMLAAQADRAEVTTAAGLAPNRVQEEFLAAGAVQCGFCTPGLVVAATALLRANPDPTDDDIHEALAGNLCRCTGYHKIVAAVRAAAGT
jgi:carbon-monoxide dehydrogenase small subunit